MNRQESAYKCIEYALLGVLIAIVFAGAYNLPAYIVSIIKGVIS